MKAKTLLAMVTAGLMFTTGYAAQEMKSETMQDAKQETMKDMKDMKHEAMKDMKDMKHEAMKDMKDMKDMKHEKMKDMKHEKMKGMKHEKMKGMKHEKMKGMMKHDKMKDMQSSAEASDMMMMNSGFGEIVGSFDSPDGMVVGATLPGKSVAFEIDPKGNKTVYLHFAMMHAKSGAKGWYFAPINKTGIKLSEHPVDITDQIGLFAAPNNDTYEKVTKDDGDLKYAPASNFMKATVNFKDGKYVMLITNISKDAIETPFSSGVWSIEKKPQESFDHIASMELSKLATSGHRDDLFKKVSGSTSDK